MNTPNSNSTTKLALVTGSAKRIGRKTTKMLHDSGYNVLIHYNQSESQATEFAGELNSIREDSAFLLRSDITKLAELETMAKQVKQKYGRLDLLVNNASSFYPTQVGEVTESIWDDLMGTNLKAPFFLIQSLSPLLKQNNGNIVNIVDIHADRPLNGYSVYCMAKAGLVMLTKSLSRELAPNIRVNGIAPGVIMWHENELSESDKTNVLNEVSLQRSGSPDDIAQAVKYLISADYVTGHILAVDGGRSVQGGDKA